MQCHWTPVKCCFLLDTAQSLCKLGGCRSDIRLRALKFVHHCKIALQTGLPVGLTSGLLAYNTSVGHTRLADSNTHAHVLLHEG